MNYDEAKSKANERGKEFTAYDFNPTHHVVVHHDDGTTLDFASALVWRIEEWIIIFAEHHDMAIYHEGDIIKVIEYDVKNIYEGIR